ncbi:MAG: type II toxin-antitoxin system VapC family toxin [Deltaproteobacteria bacterium]|nr:type II toxin-antitoxin system VapC family toxin [Deltaproteobacteria bacterium]
MRYLLDTHVWLWQLVEPERLSRKASAALDAPESELHLSPISVWEVLVLARKKRILLDEPGSWIREALQRTPASMVEITHEIAIRSESLRGFGGADPADRFLAATCLVHDLALITSDRGLRRYRQLTTLW